MDEQEKILTPEELKEVVDEEVTKRLGERPNRAARRAFKKQHHQEIDAVYETAKKLVYKEMIEKLREKNKEYVENEATEDGNANL